MTRQKPRTLDEFLALYDPDSTRVVADITPARDADGNSPFIIVRHGRFTAVLALMPFTGEGAHLCIDTFSFVDGKDATAGVFGMSNGQRSALLPSLGTKSHGWYSAHTVAVLFGEQETA